MCKISVILATYNRCEHLKKTLNSLAIQECDGRFNGEVIVINNNSTDATKEVVESYFSKFNKSSQEASSLQLRYSFEPKQGKSYALNKGISEAKGEFIAFTDDDVIIDKRWLMSIMKCFADHHCDGVGGRVLPTYPENIPEWMKEDANRMSGIVVIYNHGEHTKKYDESTMEKFIGANYAFRREVFNECGLFRGEFSRGRMPVGEDREFIDRLIRKNKTLYYCGPALIWHPVDLKRASLINIAHWHIAFGKAAAHNEFDNKQKTFVYWFGVPRYLIVGVVRDFFRIFLSLFNRKSLFLSLRKFFRKVGMIMEYKTYLNKKTVKEQKHAKD